jgi:hypothetical protein
MERFGTRERWATSIFAYEINCLVIFVERHGVANVRSLAVSTSNCKAGGATGKGSVQSLQLTRAPPQAWADRPERYCDFLLV